MCQRRDIVLCLLMFSGLEDLPSGIVPNADLSTKGNLLAKILIVKVEVLDEFARHFSLWRMFHTAVRT